MPSLRVSVRLLNGVAVFDDYSPSLDALLEWLILDRHGMAAPNPTIEDVERSRPIVAEQMPLDKASLGDDWYWQTSGPCYTYHRESIDKFRKRWAPGIDSPEPAWGKRKAKWDTSQGAEKAYDLPLFVRLTQEITWYCNGDPDGLMDLLQGCTGVGKKRAHGYGQVQQWSVTPYGHDYHLYGPDGQLMRPIPAEHLDRTRPIDIAIRDWGWRPPAWLPANKRRCAMPIHTVKLASDGRPATG